MGVPMWCRNAAFTAVVPWLQNALHTYELVDSYKAYYSWVETKQIGIQTQERESQRIEIQERGKVTDRERKGVGKGFSSIHLDLVNEIRRAMDEQHTNYTTSQVPYQPWGRQQEWRCRRTSQGGGRSRGRRRSEGACTRSNGEEGPATRAEASADQVHCQATTGTQAFRPQQTPKAEVGHHQGQGEDRTTGFDLDELCPDVPKELDRAEEDVSGQAPGGAATHETKSRAFDSLAKGVSLKGKCRRTHGGGGSDGDGRAPGANASSTMGDRSARRHGRGRQWSQQGLQCVTALWKTKQDCQDRQNKETSRLKVYLKEFGWFRIHAWFLNPFGLGRIFKNVDENAAKRDFFQGNHTGQIAKLQGYECNGDKHQPLVDDQGEYDMTHCDYETAEYAKESYYCDGIVMQQNAHTQDYGMTKCDYLIDEGGMKSYYCDGNTKKKVTYYQEYDMVNNYETAGNEVKSYYPDGNAKELFELKERKIDTNQHEECNMEKPPLAPLVKDEREISNDDRCEYDTAPTLSRQQLYYYRIGVNDQESTWEGFNSTESGNELQRWERSSMLEFWRYELNSELAAKLMALTGIFLFGIPILVAWMLTLFSTGMNYMSDVLNYEHQGSDLFCVRCGIGLNMGLTLLYRMGYIGYSNIQSEIEAYDMSIRILGNLCMYITEWCWCNKCGTLVIVIMGAFMALM